MQEKSQHWWLLAEESEKKIMLCHKIKKVDERKKEEQFLLGELFKLARIRVRRRPVAESLFLLLKLDLAIKSIVNIVIVRIIYSLCVQQVRLGEALVQIGVLDHIVHVGVEIGGELTWTATVKVSPQIRNDVLERLERLQLERHLSDRLGQYCQMALHSTKSSLQLT